MRTAECPSTDDLRAGVAQASTEETAANAAVDVQRSIAMVIRAQLNRRRHWRGQSRGDRERLWRSERRQQLARWRSSTGSVEPIHTRTRGDPADRLLHVGIACKS
ncbi:MAG: hypothetical protein A2341_09830 [Deltaproteobacteria bacterium RIFOXYB12_FULL_58_9]|nr:MAG: hypothetical protein A2341_09830 [Deltaproteobacteria bacterium RIFOXYB12_FULL_58_9]